MDYYQGVVVDYLRADRAVFVNTECCIQLKEGKTPAKNEHWYCDALAIDLRGEGGPTAFLCEVSYAVGLGKLIRRLKMWSENWAGVKAALERDCAIPQAWPLRVWLFVREEAVPGLVQKLNTLNVPEGHPVFVPRITPLESVPPWRYGGGPIQDKNTPKPNVPEEMRI